MIPDWLEETKHTTVDVTFTQKSISNIELFAQETEFLKQPEQLKSLIEDVLRLNPHSLSTNSSEKGSILYGI